MKKLAVISTHPIQYFAPIWKILASTSGVSVHVFYASDHSVRGAVDQQFGVPVKWDVPILDGYPHTFMAHSSLFERYFSFFELDRTDVDEVLKKGNFDSVLIHAYDRHLHWRALRAARRNGIRVLLRAEATDSAGILRHPLKRMIRRRVLKRFYSGVDAFLSIGAGSTRHYLKHGVDESRIFFSPYCVDSQLFEQQRSEFSHMRRQTRYDLGFGENDFVFMFSGKMIEKKNPLLIGDALERMPHLDRIGLLTVGEGNLRAGFETMTKRSLGNRAAFVGFVNQSHLGKYYTAADALILPSSWGETWGLVVNEAMIFGLPVIVSDTVGCREDLVISGETGYIFHAGDSGALAKAMTQLAENRERAKSIGMAAAELVKRYSVEAATNGIVKALEYVSAGRA